MRLVNEILALTALELRNLRSFADLTLSFAAPAPSAGQWILLLGDNGVGKTTVLRSLALALADSHTLNAILEKPRFSAPFVRHEQGDATVRVAMTRRWQDSTNSRPDDTTVRLQTSSGRESATRPNQDAPAVALPPPPFESPTVFAYGCQRGSGAASGDSLSPYAAIATLFDDSAELINPETWLQRRLLGKYDGSDNGFYDAVINTLVRLLPGVDKFDVRKEGVWVEGPGVGRARFRALSDGYAIATSWVLDMLARWTEDAERGGTPLDAQFAERMTGLVLIDELDLHLHPRWQTEIVSSLRTAFPRLSFVATTHNPLTLLGAQPGEVHVLRRDEQGLVTAFQTDVPKGARADQILTGGWFNLTSTIDPETRGLLDQHRTLLQKGVDVEDPQRRELEANLRQRLGGFADTSLERLAQSAAAEVMSESHQPLSADDRASIREKVVARLRTQGR